MLLRKNLGNSLGGGNALLRKVLLWLAYANDSLCVCKALEGVVATMNIKEGRPIT